MQTNVPKEPRIRLVLVDDHPVVLSGLRHFLSTIKHLEIVGEACGGEEAIDLATRLRPDVMLMDITMRPHMNGIVATREITRSLPTVKVILLTIHEEPEYLKQFVNCGAHGYLLKNTSPMELVQAIEAVHRGEAYLSPTAAQILVDSVRGGIEAEIEAPPPSVLSTMEVQILKYIAEGRSSKMIADDLTKPIRTIEKHRQNIMARLDIHSIAELTHYAVKHKLIARR